jgi:hypothetical protein
MGTTWVLHTETKGTGAQVVPLDKAKQRSKSTQPQFIRPQKGARAREQEAPEPRSPRRFRIVDVMTRQRLADEAGISDALAALKNVRSIVDANVYVWEEGRGRWRPMTFEEEHTLMELAAELEAGAV